MDSAAAKQLPQEEDLLAKFDRTEVLGSGTYGIVYKATDTRTGEQVALKRIRLENLNDGVPATMLREVAMLKQLSGHPNIVRLNEVLHSNQKLSLVFEYYDYDLKKLIESKKKLDSRVIRSIMKQIFYGMAYSHQFKIYHRDLKGQNVFIKNNGLCAIGDWGLASSFSLPVRLHTNEIVTLWYRAPEILLGSRKYSGQGVDMWSIGCIFAELVTGKPLLPARNEHEELIKIFRLFGSPSPSSSLRALPGWKDDELPNYQPTPVAQILPDLDDYGRDLFLKLMQLEPNKRISCKDALVHPYFSHGQTLFPSNYDEQAVQKLLDA